MSLQFQISPGGRLQGEAKVPGDKSISHRAVMLSAIAEGTSEVQGFLEGEDTLATMLAMQRMGVRIERAQDRLTIEGRGLWGLRAPDQPLDLGNAGTAIRLLTGLLSGQTFGVTLTGDASLRSRPMKRILDPLHRMGAEISAHEGRAPLKISGGQPLSGIRYDMPIASAQVKSCLLLAGLYAQGETRVLEPGPTRDHSERMLQGMGYEVETGSAGVALRGGGRLKSRSIEVPGDISSAAFLLVGASVAPQSDLLLKNVGINPSRDGILRILERMGARIAIENRRMLCGEPVADLRVRASELQGIEVPRAWVPLAIDEFPALLIAAACAQGRTVVRGAEELRVKESDRIEAMARGLSTLGVSVQTAPDGITVEGGALGGGTVDSCSDHRVAMAFSIAGLVAKERIVVNDCANVATSFPDFLEHMRALGLSAEAAQS